jgi:hypothetical protein
VVGFVVALVVYGGIRRVQTGTRHDVEVEAERPEAMLGAP